MTAVAFSNAFELLEERQALARLTTGSADLDSLLGGGLSPGAFYLFYGDGESGVDLLMHELLVNTLLPAERNGLGGEAVYLNCGSYRSERTVLDVEQLTTLAKANGLDLETALECIRVFLAFSGEQEEQVVGNVVNAIRQTPEVKTLVVHSIAKLFSLEAPPRMNRVETLERLSRLQAVVSQLWQTCAEKGVVLAASCRPRPNSRRRYPKPEGGQYLRHAANVLVHLRRVEARSPFIEAALVKHPNRAPARTRFTFNAGGVEMGRITIPFRTRFEEQLSSLRRDLREALMDPSRREAFDLLVKALTGEMGAMSHAKIPTVLDVMMFVAAVENRRVSAQLEAEFKSVAGRLDRLEEALRETVIMPPSRPIEQDGTGASA